MKESQVVAEIRSVNSTFAELRPAFRLLDSGECEPIEEIEKEFPDRGSLIWFYRGNKPSSGSVWQVEFEASPTYDGITKRDRFRVNPESATNLHEIIDLMRFGDPEFIKRQLIGEGIHARIREGLLSAVLRIGESDFVGPVNLDSNGDKLRLSDNEDRSCITYRDLRKDDILTPEGVLHGRLFIRDSKCLHTSARLESWESDVELLRKVVHRLRKIDQTKFNELGITYRVFDAYIDAIESANLTPEQREIEKSRARKLVTIKGDIEFDQQLMQDAVDFLRRQPSVNQAFQKSIEVDKARVIENLDNDLRDSREELARLKGEVSLLQKEKDAKTAEIARHVDVLEDALQHKLLAAMEQPAECLADIAIFNAVFHQINAARSGPRLTALDSLSTDTPDTMVQSCEALYAVLNNNLMQFDADQAIAKQLHAAFLSGQIPVLIGTRAFAALNAYGQSVGNGSTMWCPISARTVDTSDILHVDRVCLWLEEAVSTDAMRLLVLDGVNNAGAESALTPLASCYSESWLGLQLRHLTFQIGSQLKVSAWPKNILVAAVANIGSTSLPLPTEFWYHSMPIGCSPRQRYFSKVSSHPFCRGASCVTGQVDVATWSEWRLRVTSQCLDPIESLLGKFDNKFSLKREVLDQTICYFSALRSQGVDEKNSVGLATLSCIVPHLNEDNKSVRDLFLEIGFDEGYAGYATDVYKVISDIQLK